MGKDERKTPLAFWGALLNIAMGTAGIITGLLLELEHHGIEQFFLGLLLLGIGEYLNNPPRPQLKEETEKPGFLKRKRNVCGLGNLLDILGVLMLAVGLATLFF